jgi:mono/diheme cytochrome c family protein
MARLAAPLIALVVVSAAVFALAQWHPFSPAEPAVARLDTLEGDPVRGAAIFAASCAGCHGADATGGAGPALRGSGINGAEVLVVIATGQGAMPAGIVSGRDAADVAAHVAAIAK